MTISRWTSKEYDCSGSQTGTICILTVMIHVYFNQKSRSLIKHIEAFCNQTEFDWFLRVVCCDPFVNCNFNHFFGLSFFHH